MNIFLTKTLIFFAAVLTLALPVRASEPETAVMPTRSVKVATKLKASAESIRVQLNSATRIELQQLPGIGTATAQAILDYRAYNKGFVDVQELQNVRGIGRKKFVKLVPFVKL
jgi:competence protein ComEA